MKHIVSFLLIILSLNSRAYSQEYNELFSDMDSVAKTEISNHVYRIIKMLNYEYNQINDSLLVEERVVLTTLKIDSENKLSIFKINDINTDIAEPLNQWFKKAPPLPLEDLKKYSENNGVYLSSDFKCDWKEPMHSLDKYINDSSQDKSISNKISQIYIVYK